MPHQVKIPVLSASDLLCGIPVSYEDGEPMTLCHLLLDVERAYIIAILMQTGGSVSKAAKILGRNRTELYRKLQFHQISPGFYRHERE